MLILDPKNGPTFGPNLLGAQIWAQIYFGIESAWPGHADSILYSILDSLFYSLFDSRFSILDSQFSILNSWGGKSNSGPHFPRKCAKILQFYTVWEPLGI